MFKFKDGSDSRSEFDRTPFRFSDYQNAASDFFYHERGIPKRVDVRVAASVYFPDCVKEQTKWTFLPKSMFPVPSEVLYLAIVKCYGAPKQNKLRGYLDVRKYTNEEGLPGPEFTTVAKGQTVGPRDTDVAWEDLVRISNQLLLAFIPAAESTKYEETPEPSESGETDEVTEPKLLGVVDAAWQLKKSQSAAETKTKFRHKFTKGERIDCYSDGRWYAATVRDVREGDAPSVLVHYDHFSADNDEWVPARSRLAPLHKFTKPDTGTAGVAAPAPMTSPAAGGGPGLVSILAALSPSPSAGSVVSTPQQRHAMSQQTKAQPQIRKEKGDVILALSQQNDDLRRELESAKRRIRELEQQLEQAKASKAH